MQVIAQKENSPHGKSCVTNGRRFALSVREAASARPESQETDAAFTEELYELHSAGIAPGSDRSDVCLEPNERRQRQQRRSQMGADTGAYNLHHAGRRRQDG